MQFWKWFVVIPFVLGFEESSWASFIQLRTQVWFTSMNEDGSREVLLIDPSAVVNPEGTDDYEVKQLGSDPECRKRWVEGNLVGKVYHAPKFIFNINDEKQAKLLVTTPASDAKEEESHPSLVLPAHQFEKLGNKDQFKILLPAQRTCPPGPQACMADYLRINNAGPIGENCANEESMWKDRLIKTDVRIRDLDNPLANCVIPEALKFDVGHTLSCSPRPSIPGSYCISPRVVGAISKEIFELSQCFGVDPQEMIPLFLQESKFQTEATNSANRGIGQLDSTSAQAVVKDAETILENIYLSSSDFQKWYSNYEAFRTEHLMVNPVCHRVKTLLERKEKRNFAKSISDPCSLVATVGSEEGWANVLLPMLHYLSGKTSVMATAVRMAEKKGTSLSHEVHLKLEKAAQLIGYYSHKAPIVAFLAAKQLKKMSVDQLKGLSAKQLLNALMSTYPTDYKYFSQLQQAAKTFKSRPTAKQSQECREYLDQIASQLVY